MQENQYILKPSGILDRSSASALFQRMLEKQERSILVDCADMQGALHEGAMELAKSMLQWKGAACRFENLPQMLAVRLQLAGIPVSRRAASFPAGNAPAGALTESHAVPAGNDAVGESVESAGGIHGAEGAHEARAGMGPDNVVPCRRCESPVRIPGPGLYACPHCGAHFHADVRGRSIVYEPLVRLD